MTTPADGEFPALPPELSPRAGGGPAVPARGAGGGAGGGGRRRSGPDKPRHLLRKIAAVASALIVLSSATGYAVSQHYLGGVKQISVFPGLTNRPAKVDVPAQNILVAGVDDRSTLTAEQRREYHTGKADVGRRSDTMILMHISDRQKAITAISLPRDSLVTIPAYTDAAGVKHAESKNKLNAAFAFGGAKLTIATIEKATGVRIDHYAEVDLGGFVRMVNAVGGVDVCTTTAVYDKDSGLNLPAGKSHLNGVQGLEFVRARHIYADQDLGRIRAQQKFVASMVKRATSKGVLLDPIKLNKFLGAAVKSVSTDMSESELRKQVLQMRDYKPSAIKFLTVPISNPNATYQGQSVAKWDKPAARELFAKLRNDQPLESAAKAGAITVPPGSITVQVLNGAGVQGLGSKAANDLAGLGFGMADIAKNASVTGQTATIVKYDPRYAASSKTVVAAIPGATAQAVPGLGRTIQVVVGSSYKGVKTVKVTGATPSSTPKARTAADNICG